jgi:hypothetical protein
VVGTDYPEAEVMSRQYGASAGTYPDLDLFNRVVTCRWTGYEIPSVSRVSNVVNGPGGRVYSMPGGGYEMQFPYSIPPEFISVVR